MEIDNNRIASLVTHTRGQGASVDKQHNDNSKAGGERSSPSASSTDRVSLTGEARQLKELESGLASRPVVDSQRVEAVRSAVESGTFKVNPERIAEKLISLEQALTGGR
jgi:negative regulator of flagellin synthesis FlgM